MPSRTTSTIRITTIEFVLADEPTAAAPAESLTPASELSLEELRALDNKFNHEIAKRAIWGMELAIVDLWHSLYNEQQRHLGEQLNEERRQLSNLIDEDWDPAAAAKILRRIARIEMDLERSRLTKKQLSYITELRDNRATFWYMIPEGT